MTHRRGHRISVLPLLVAALATVLSLASVVSTQAMPVEARTTEPWYAYKTTVGFDFLAHVQPGRFYPDAVMKPSQLISVPGPVQPPTFKRVLIGRFTEAIEVKIPYSFLADRPTNLKANWRVDGTMLIPGVWQKPYPLLAPKEISVNGSEISGVETFLIPLTDLYKEMEENRSKFGIQAEPVEIHIKPTLEVEAADLKEPMKVSSSGDFVITLRSTLVEVDDARDTKAEKNFADTKIVPITISVFGAQVRVGLLRQVSIISLVLFIMLGIGLVLLRRKKPDSRSILQKLGPNLIVARAFELPGDVTVVDVRTARELVQLHTHTERPVIRVGGTCYLQDGTTCYRLNLSEAAESE